MDCCECEEVRERMVVSVFGFQGYLQVDSFMIECPLIGGLLVTETGNIPR